MKIGIIGAGSMASVLGKRWANNGHLLFFGARDLEKANAVAQDVGNGATAGSMTEAAEFGDVVLLSVRSEAAIDVLNAAGAPSGTFEGKVLIDCNNPVELENLTLTVGFTTSLAEEIAKASSGLVVKAFNMAQAKVWALDPPLFDGRPMTVFYCGDDEQAKQKVAQLITEMGFEPLDMGALRQARLLEPAGNIVIYLLFNGYSPYTVLNLSKRDDLEQK